MPGPNDRVLVGVTNLNCYRETLLMPVRSILEENPVS